MKYNRNKAWPYPVLQSNERDGDYPRHAFEVESSLEIDSGSGSVTVRCEFMLGHRGMERLIKEQRAQYVLVVRSPATHYRGEFTSFTPEIEYTFLHGQLGGHVELIGFVVAKKPTLNFSLKGWNKEYRSREYNIDESAVLAIDQPWGTWLDQTADGPLQSIFELRPVKDKGKIRWRCNLDSERIQLEMTEVAAEQFKSARTIAETDPHALSQVMNGVYLPALIHVLELGDRDAAESDVHGYADRRWFNALNDILDRNGLPRLGEGQDRASDAQVILREPFNALLTSITGTAS